jgi:hypothetical protein
MASGSIATRELHSNATSDALEAPPRALSIDLLIAATCELCLPV